CAVSAVNLTGIRKPERPKRSVSASLWRPRARTPEIFQTVSSRTRVN
ncbi:MAG: hypothetical protein AVDCRST_MAG01-01-2584, partial [uncultured Rubrobacteraceae bacterium]